MEEKVGSERGESENSGILTSYKLAITKASKTRL